MGLISSTIPLEELLAPGNIKFKSAQFNWIGRAAPGVNITFVKAKSPAKTIQDVFKREVILGATGRSSTIAVYPSVLSSVIGTKFKLVMGYAGSPRRCWRWSAGRWRATPPASRRVRRCIRPG